MKRFTIVLISIVLSQAVFAQKGALRVTQSDYTHAAYSFKAPQPSISTVTVGQRTFDVIEMEGTTPSTTIGRPNLPVISQMIAGEAPRPGVELHHASAARTQQV